MSLVITDQYTLATTANPIELSLATQASVALRIKATAVGTTTNIVQLGGNGVKIAIGAGGTYVSVVWTNTDGSKAVVTASTTPGNTYHVVSTYDASGSGNAILYLNDVSSSTAATGATLHATGTASINASTAPNTITVQHVAIWKGYLLSGSDRVALRDGTATPESIGGAASARAYWTLAGTIGATPTAGDVALDNYYGTHADSTAFSSLSGTGSVVYGAALYYTPPVHIQKAEITYSGKLLMLWPTLSADDSDVTDFTVSTMPTVTAVGDTGTRSGALVPLSDGQPWTPPNVVNPYGFLMPSGVVVDSSDTVTLDVADAWAVADEGSFHELVDFAVTNYAGISSNGADVESEQTLKLGINLTSLANRSNPFHVPRNWRYRGNWSTSNVTTTGPVAGSDDGTPVSISAGQAKLAIHGNGSSTLIDDHAIPGPTGYWAIGWDGPDTWDLNATNGTISEVTSVANAGDGSGNGKARVFDIQANTGEFSIGVEARCTSGSGGSVSNPTSVKIYGPGDFTFEDGVPVVLDDADPYEIGAEIYAAFPDGVDTVRVMDSTGVAAGTSAITEPEQMRLLSDFSWGTGYRETFSVGLTAIRPLTVGASAYVYCSWYGSPYDVVLADNITTTPAAGTLETYTIGATGEPVFRGLVLTAGTEKMRIISVSGTDVTVERGSLKTTPATHSAGTISCNGRANVSSKTGLQGGQVMAELVTDGPHNLITGTIVKFLSTVSWTDTSTVSRNYNGYRICVHVVDATTLWVTFGHPPGDSSLKEPVSSTTLDPGTDTLFFQAPVDTTIPWGYGALIANKLSANLWVNLPQGCSDALADAIAEEVLDNLTPGKTVYVEYTNEPWNLFFAQTQFLSTLSMITEGSADYSSIPAGAKRSVQLFQRFLAVFTAAGRGSEPKNVWNSQITGTPQDTQALDVAVATGRAFDAIAVAPYLTANKNYPRNQLAYHMADVEQRIDLFTWEQRYSTADNVQYVKAHKAAVDAYNLANGTSANLVSYEGSLDQLTPYNTPITLDGAIDSSQTSITVSNAATIGLYPGVYLSIEDEWVLITAVSGNDLTVTRGANGTTAASHSTGVSVKDATYLHWCHDMAYHPNIYRAMLDLLRDFQDNGLDLLTYYALIKPWQSDGKNWSLRNWIYQQAGRGDGSDGKANNLLTLARPGETYTKSAGDNQDFENVAPLLLAYQNWIAPSPISETILRLAFLPYQGL